MDNHKYITALIADRLGASPKLTPSLFGGFRAEIRLSGQLLIGGERNTESGALIALAEMLELTPTQRETRRDCPLFDSTTRQSNLI